MVHCPTWRQGIGVALWFQFGLESGLRLRSVHLYPVVLRALAVKRLLRALGMRALEGVSGDPCPIRNYRCFCCCERLNIFPVIFESSKWLFVIVLQYVHAVLETCD